MVSKATLSIILGVSVLGRLGGGSVAAPSSAESFALRPSPFALARFEYSQIHMGIRVNLTLYARSEEAAERAARAGFGEFARLEQIMSDYRPDSELMRFCAKAGQGPQPIGKDLFRVLWHAQDVARLSSGAFDVTCSPVVRLWRQARKDGKMPPAEALQSALKLVGWKKLKLDRRAQTAELTVPGMLLDLGGVAKGDACDFALAAIKKAGIRSAMVECGGDITLGAAPPGSWGWPIKILGSSEQVQHLSNVAISTSGDAYQFVEIDGKRYSHICDPRTGLGLSNRLQATVIANRGLRSDPLTKVICVLGPGVGRRLACREGAAAVFIVTP
ncbi:MAG: FAD:protein FMN transferase [Armatimonadetes bacterium]|nr:FAD:protein FMN transferase [Armatimonadota bacterium]